MEKGYRFRIYPTKEQERQIQKTFDCVRYVYNYYLVKRKEVYKTEQRNFGYRECSSDLTALKQENTWLKESDCIALQTALKHLQDGYDNYFRDRAKGSKKWEMPKPKRKKDREKSYTSKNINSNIKILEKHIQLPKLGLVECRVSKKVEERILSATVTKGADGKYYVSICCTGVEMPNYAPTDSVTLLDMAEVSYKVTRKDEKRLARLERQQTRKVIGSANSEKSRVKLAKLHEHTVNCRNDYYHKLSTELVRKHDVIVIENQKAPKKTSEANNSELVRQLKYKAGWHGRKIVQTDANVQVENDRLEEEKRVLNA